MNNEILVNIDPLLKATNEGEIKWRLIENTSCLTTSFNRNKFIICRYTFEENRPNYTVIAFNYLNDDETEREFLQWAQNEKEFEKLNELYNTAESHSSVLEDA